MKDKDIDEIINDEVRNMVDRLKERGIEGDRFIVTVKSQVAVPNKVKENEPYIGDFDELLRQIKKQKKEKCPSCGEIEYLYPVTKTGDIKLCKKCKDECDIYAKRIISAIKNNDEIDMLNAISEYLSRNPIKETTEPEPNYIEEFVYDNMLKNFDFESKDDIIDFLADIEEFIESDDFEL